MPGEYLAQMPDDLKANEILTSYPTSGELGKAHVETVGKLKESDGKVKSLEGKIGDLEKNSIPKLAENATPEQRDAFYKALGRPDKPEQYEIPEVNGQKNSPEMISWAQKEFHRLGIPAGSGKELATSFNTFLQGIVKAETDKREKERTDAETALKTELGDKFDASVEMVRRVWKKHSNAEFDSFVNETKIGNDARLIRFMINIAKLTGEDQSISGTPEKGERRPIWFDKTPGMGV